MSKYTEKAGLLQDKVRRAERENTEEFDEATVNRAIVYGRQDLVLLVSHIASVNEQLTSIRRLLIALLLVFIVSLLLLFK